MVSAVTESIVAILVLFLIAGGGIIVVDALIIRKIRQLRPPAAPESRSPEDSTNNR